MFKKVYATASVRLKNRITVFDEHAIVFDISEDSVIFSTSRNIAPIDIENVIISMIAGKSKCVFSCKPDDYKIINGVFVYKARLPQDKEITLPNGKKIKLVNQSLKKYKSSIINGKTRERGAEEASAIDKIHV